MEKLNSFSLDQKYQFFFSRNENKSLFERAIDEGNEFLFDRLCDVLSQLTPEKQLESLNFSYRFAITVRESQHCFFFSKILDLLEKLLPFDSETVFKYFSKNDPGTVLHWVISETKSQAAIISYLKKTFHFLSKFNVQDQFNFLSSNHHRLGTALHFAVDSRNVVAFLLIEEYVTAHLSNEMKLTLFMKIEDKSGKNVINLGKFCVKPTCKYAVTRVKIIECGLSFGSNMDEREAGCYCGMMGHTMVYLSNKIEKELFRCRIIENKKPLSVNV